MPATFVHDGDTIDHIPSVSVAAGAVVVQNDLIGVAKVPIAANALGALAVTGIFDFPKATGTDTAIAAGATVYWHSDAQQANATASGGKLLGKSVKTASDSDAAVRVRMSQ